MGGSCPSYVVGYLVGEECWDFEDKRIVVVNLQENVYFLTFLWMPVSKEFCGIPLSIVFFGLEISLSQT